MTPRYVRHISGRGDMWTVAHDTPDRWKVYQGDEFTEALTLSKADYALVEKKAAP